MRKAAADLEFEEAGRLRDEIRRLEEDDLGIPHDQRVAPRPLGNSLGRQARHAQGPVRQAVEDAVRREAMRWVLPCCSGERNPSTGYEFDQ